MKDVGGMTTAQKCQDFQIDNLNFKMINFKSTTLFTSHVSRLTFFTFKI